MKKYSCLGIFNAFPIGKKLAVILLDQELVD